MFAPTRYLVWARRFYGKVRFDLATSGISAASIPGLEKLGNVLLDHSAAWEQQREAVARHNGVGAAEALPTLGTSHALWLAYAALAGPGDDILVEEPAYEPLLRAAEGVGARVNRFVRDPRERFAIDPDRVARALTPRTRVVAITNLHNPSGVRASDEELRATAQLLEERGSSLLVDEVYAAFDDLTDPQGVFPKSARKIAPNVVAVSSLTKCYGLGAHRIGWLLASPGVVARAEDALTATCGILPLTHAQAALAAFASIDDLAARARSLLAGKRERVRAWIEALGLEWSDPAEGLFGLVTMQGAGDLTATIESAARDRGVLVAPGAFFGVPSSFRLAWAAPSPVLEEGLGQLAECLQEAR
jgi:aspartate/methionine/tyrosine aminotransferase